MNAKFFWLSILAIIISFFGGFYLANSLNGSELNKMRAENEQLKKTTTEQPQNNSEASLSDDEIRQKIVEADKNPDNMPFQRNLGLALYRYGVMKKDASLIAESARLLQRVYDKNPKDYDATVALGNAFFDIGFFKKDAQSLQKGREFYQKALEQKPDDADVKTDLGISYYVAEPPDFEKASAQLQKALETDSKHERALLFMAQTLLKQNNPAEAEKYLARLKAINPQTPSLAELSSQISEGGNTIQK
ncbi:MAG TPA: tetratricopeptide repeat protein [Pyrinomonadaceae bacterium]|jgi:tetratricopeptide (TPR) repeat protein|nr:tetratricopeptide repeat protein [Pyrinomonadaceae bacterium]